MGTRHAGALDELLERLRAPIYTAWSASCTALDRLDRQRNRRLSVTPEYYDLPYEALTLKTADGLDLDAWFVPAATTTRRTGLMALLHHHYGGQKAALLPWIELLHRRGVASLCFDARGHAASPCAAHEASFVRRLHDARAAAAELRHRGARRLLAYGQSQGAAVVVSGLYDQSDLAAVILDSGPAPAALPAMWGLARTMFPESQPGRTLATSFTAARLLHRTRPGGHYSATLLGALWRLRDRPLLWLHGSADAIIPHGVAGLWFRALQPRARYWRALLVPDAAHVQCLQQNPKLVETAIDQLLGDIG